MEKKIWDRTLKSEFKLWKLKVKRKEINLVWPKFKLCFLGHFQKIWQNWQSVDWLSVENNCNFHVWWFSLEVVQAFGPPNTTIIYIEITKVACFFFILYSTLSRFDHCSSRANFVTSNSSFECAFVSVSNAIWAAYWIQNHRTRNMALAWTVVNFSNSTVSTRIFAFQLTFISLISC